VVWCRFLGLSSANIQALLAWQPFWLLFKKLGYFFQSSSPTAFNHCITLKESHKHSDQLFQTKYSNKISISFLEFETIDAIF
jgi:hypothetical protein